MSTYRRIPGVGDVNAYLGSGVPYASSSISVPNGTTIALRFPGVSKYLTVKNLNAGVGQTLLLGFSSNGIESKGRTNVGPLSGSGVHANYISIGPGSSYSADVKVSRIFLRPSGSYSISAEVAGGMTNIPATDLAHNWSGSAGVG